MNIDIGLLVASCDKYSDLWDPFFGFMDKYWSDCMIPIYLMANNKKYESVNQLFSDKGSWTKDLLSVLEQFPHEYVLYIQDDYLLNRKVDNQEVARVLQIVKVYDPAYLRLFPHRGPKKNVLLKDCNDVQYIQRGEPFITSLQAAIWHVPTLKKLLFGVENIWEFEINSPQRTLQIERPFLSFVWQQDKTRDKRIYPINYFCTAIRKGKWRKDAVDFCVREGIPIDLSARLIENWWDLFKKDYIYNKISAKYQPFFMKWLW